MNKQTQKLWTINQIERYGSVTRNKALNNYITRLSAIIFDLKKDGWEITGTVVKNKYKNINLVGDYRYTGVKK